VGGELCGDGAEKNEEWDWGGKGLGGEISEEFDTMFRNGEGRETALRIQHGDNDGTSLLQTQSRRQRRYFLHHTSGGVRDWGVWESEGVTSQALSLLSKARKKVANRLVGTLENCTLATVRELYFLIPVRKTFTAYGMRWASCVYLGIYPLGVRNIVAYIN